MEDFKFGRGRKKKTDFNPNHDFVSSAVEDFIKNGGKIRKVPLDYVLFMGGKAQIAPADEFLLGV